MLLARGRTCSRHHQAQSVGRATANVPRMGPVVHAAPQVSDRVLDTDTPCIVAVKKIVSKYPQTLSLAQGIVHWQPPPQALQAASKALTTDPSISGYGPADGMPALREALRKKIVEKNGLKGYDVMVTAGANQAFVNVVLTLVDANDSVVLYTPYYFNHLMALQMTGGGRQVVLGPPVPGNLHPDLDWLETALSGANGQPVPKMVVITNPSNPTGVTMTASEVSRAAAICARAGTWLVLDNTYEDFLYEGREHYCQPGPHVINLFSFSKAYGLMGWRVGYIAYPDLDGSGALGRELLKVQDTIPICPTQLSQHMALAALEQGEEYMRSHVADLEGNRHLVMDALSPLGARGDAIAGGEGAIYFWARLPPGCEDDTAVVEWLVAAHKVAVIPGSACGAPGYVRVAFGNLTPDVCAQACARLKAGLQQLMDQGPAVLATVQHAVSSAPSA